MRSTPERRAFCRALTCALWLTFMAGGVSVAITAAEQDWLSVAIKRAVVNSTNLRSIGYHHNLQVLEIEFRSGTIYRYRDVPPNAYEALIRADSKGRHFSREIRGRYEFMRIDKHQP